MIPAIKCKANIVLIHPDLGSYSSGSQNVFGCELITVYRIKNSWFFG